MGMKCGDKFQGMRLMRSLDMNLKKYRQVFLCEGEKEVLTVYDRTCTPSRMCLGINRLPLEYVIYLRFKSDPLSGLPPLLSYGYDKNHVWLVTEYIPMKGLMEHMDGKYYRDKSAFEIFEAFVGYMKSFFMANSLLLQNVVPLCISPENLSISDSNEVSCHITGLDTMLFPAYGGFKPESYYDTRYLAPEILTGEYNIKSISYSYALSVLSVYRNMFPLPATDLHQMESADETVLRVQNVYDELDKLGLPEPMLEEFRAYLNPDFKQRELFFERYDSVRRMEQRLDDRLPDCGETESIRMMMNAMNANPYEGCFMQTKGRGLYDVGGMREAKEKVQNILSYYRHPEYAQRHNMSLNNILLLGPPGTGKSFFAEKLGEQLGLPYCLAHTSDMVGSYHGESARNIRGLFDEAEKNAPCLLVLDEFDCVAQKRNVEMSPGAAEPCNELLSQINECNKKGIIVVATTNSIQNVDPAMIRGKRFDTKIYIGTPDNDEKETILRCVMRDRPNTLLDNDYTSLAQIMEHFVGADIASVVDAVSNTMFVEYGNDLFRRYFESMNADGDKAEYLEFIHAEHLEISEESFYTWCMVKGRFELQEDYQRYSHEQDIAAEPDKITYEKLEKAVKEYLPSSSTQLEREFEQKYQDFLPERERKRTRIGF